MMYVELCKSFDDWYHIDDDLTSCPSTSAEIDEHLIFVVCHKYIHASIITIPFVFFQAYQSRAANLKGR